MKTTLIQLSIIVISTICFNSCINDNNFTIEPNEITDVELQNEAKRLCLPIEIVKDLSAEAKQSRISSFIISDHIYFDGNKQKISISEEEAFQLGIPHHHYAYAVNYLNQINELNIQIENSGKTHEIIDVKKHADSIRKNNLYYPTSLNRKISRGDVSPDNYTGVLESSYGTVDSVEVVSQYDSDILLLSCKYDVSKTKEDFSVYKVLVIVQTSSSRHTETVNEEVELTRFDFIKGGNIYTYTKPDIFNHKFKIKFTVIGADGFLVFYQGARELK